MMSETPDRRRQPGEGTTGPHVRSQDAELSAGHDRDAPQPTGQGRIVRTATEARQGEIILGKWGRWVWIGSFALLVVLLLVLGFWR